MVAVSWLEYGLESELLEGVARSLSVPMGFVCGRLLG